MTGEEFSDALANYASSAFRLEQQPAYQVSYEADNLAAFLAGNPISPAEVPGFPQWAATIRRQTLAGRIMTRVRVHDEPLTDYQRWLRWGDGLNIEAGEVIRYLSRQSALAMGLHPEQGDWWLLDGARLVVMAFNSRGALTETTLTDDSAAVAEALRQRDISLRLSTPAT
jgi:hypothetical protein